MHPFVHMHRYESEREMSRSLLWFRSLFSFYPLIFFSSFSVETRPLESLTHANKSRMSFINLSLERRRGGLDSDSKCMSDPHSTRPCRVTFLNLQDLPESLAPPVLHLPTTCPAGSLARAPAPCLHARQPRAGGGAPAVSYIAGDSRAERKKNRAVLTRCAP